MPTVVDLPAPFGPSRPNTSPGATSKSMPFTASTQPGSRIVGEPAGADDGVVEAARGQLAVRAGLGFAVGPRLLRPALGVAGTDRRDHHVAPDAVELRRLDQLHGAAVIHRLLACGP